MIAEPRELEVERGGRTLRGRVEDAAEAGAVPVVLAHGLTAHRDLTVHGSHALPRMGHALVVYDARGHGESDPGNKGSYDYRELADDLDAVLAAGVGEEERPLLAGHSMGAHTIAALALRDPTRFAGLVLIGPAVTGEMPDESSLANWDELAAGIETGGIDGFLSAYEAQGMDPEWRETLLRIARERLEKHRHIEAVAAAIREVPRSIPFEGIGALAALELPVMIVASRDQADPGHPYAVAEAWAETIPGSRLISEAEGESPLAWQGGKLSREIAGFAAEDAVRERTG